MYEARLLAEAWALYGIDRDSGDPEWHLYGALTAWHMRNLFSSRTAAEAGLLCSPTGEVEAKLHFIHGTVLREVGEDCGALAAFDVCLSLLGDLDNLSPLLRGPCLHNRSMALRAMRRLPEALQGYQEAIGEFEREGMTNHHCQSLQHLAWVAIDLEDALAAGDAIERASSLAQTGIAKQRRRLLDARYSLLIGEETEALLACESIADDPASPADVKSLAFSIGAEIGLRRNLIAEAEALARLAVNHATEYQTEYTDCRCLTVASDVFRRVQQRKMEAGV